MGDNLDERELSNLRQSGIISIDRHRSLQNKIIDMINNDVEMGHIINLIDTFDEEDEEYIHALERINKVIIEGD